MHIYSFGSICRGEIDQYSDIDMLAIVNGTPEEKNISPNNFSIYSEKRILDLWESGNPFAWHLHLESVNIFSSEKVDYLSSLGSPNEYSNWPNDSMKFHAVFTTAHQSISDSNLSETFDLAMIFLGIRNFATCYSLTNIETPNFSRHAALHLGGDSLSISESTYSSLEQARILSSRGIGPKIHHNEIKNIKNELNAINDWMKRLMDKEH